MPEQQDEPSRAPKLEDVLIAQYPTAAQIQELLDGSTDIPFEAVAPMA